MSLQTAHIIYCIQYCAKVTQAKCANFVLCLRELSRKVRAKVRVTIRGLLNEISLEQRTLFLRIFGTKRNFTMTSVISLAQCPKFRVKTDTTIPHTIHSIFPSCNVREIYRRFSTHSLTRVQSRTERMRITSKTYHE